MMNSFSSQLYVDLHTVVKLEEKMEFVRRSNVNWNNLLSAAVNSSYPLHEYMYHVLYHMFELSTECKFSHFLCILTYVTDVCVLKIMNKENVDVGKTIDCLFSFLSDKNVNLFHVTRFLSL